MTMASAFTPLELDVPPGGKAGIKYGVGGAITAVTPGGLAAEAGLNGGAESTPNWWLVEVDGKPIKRTTNASETKQLLQSVQSANKPYKLVFVPRGSTPHKKEQNTTMDAIVAQLQGLDVNEDGTLDKADVISVLSRLEPEQWSESNVKDLLDAADGNRDGRIYYKEFIDWLFCSNPALCVDALDSVEDLAQQSLSRIQSGAGFPEEMVLDCQVNGVEIDPKLREQRLHRDANDNEFRAQICQRLRETGFMENSHPLFMHGRAYDGPLRSARVTWECNEPPRAEHDTPEWLTASEFQDVDEVCLAKVRCLAALMRTSIRTVIYTGAGISASVVGQAALSGQNTVGFKAKPAEAKPTFTHYALGFLAQEGLIHAWVQQNHDGLPQKAGYPQECINEIHGSWYDPSNPVVKYGGSCSARYERWMLEDAETADLVLVLGTSLGGLYADRVATKTANRSLYLPTPESGKPEIGARIETKSPGRSYPCDFEGSVIATDGDALTVKFDKTNIFPDPVVLPCGHPVTLLRSGGLGTVCINLQQTPQDGCFTLRLFDTSDNIMKALLGELGYGPLKTATPAWPSDNRILVPYDADGLRVVDHGENVKWMWLDLREGQHVRIPPGHNIQAARQPHFMHIGASKPVKHKGVTRNPAPGLGKVVRRDAATCSFVLLIEGVEMKLGIWWLLAAQKGTVAALPLVNQKPVFASPP